MHLTNALFSVSPKSLCAFWQVVLLRIRSQGLQYFWHRSAPYLALANRLFHVDWELAVWNKNCMLSTTDRLLTPWKYGTHEIAHMGIANLQVCHFSKLFCLFFYIVEKRSLCCFVMLNNQSYLNYALVNRRTSSAWCAPEQWASTARR